MIQDKPNHDIARKVFGGPGFKVSPRRINFYHMSFDGGQLRVRHYLWHPGKPGDKDETINALSTIRARGSTEAGGANIDDALKALATIAHEDTDGKSPWLRTDSRDFQDVGTNYDGVLWKWRSYVAFMFDDPNWQIAASTGNKSAIRFDADAGDHGNHSFFDGFDDIIDVGSGTTRRVACMLNHMRKNDGGARLEAGDGIQHVKFDIHVDATLANNPKPLRIVIDPGGGNQGPPDGDD